MHTPTRTPFQSSLVQRLPGSQLDSAEPIALTDAHTLPSEQAFSSGKTSGAASEDHTYSPKPVEEDEFVEISYDDLRLSIYPADPAHLAALFGYQEASNRSLLSRSRSSISRLKKLPRASLKRPREVLLRTRAKDAQATPADLLEGRALAFDLSRPSTSSDSSSGASSPPRTPSPHSAPPLFIRPDPTREADTCNDKDCPNVHRLGGPADDPESLALVPLSTPHSPKAKSLASSLRRLRTLSRSSLFSARRHAREVCQDPPAETSASRACLRSSRLLSCHRGPVPSASCSAYSHRARSCSFRSLLASTTHRSSRSEPSSADLDRISRFWSTPPSPSWLSRNVEGIEPATTSSPLPLPIPPPSSPPLYIVPRSLRPDSYYLREPEIDFEFTTAPQTPRSTTSSVTLYNPSQRVSFLGPSSPIGSRPASTNRFSVIYRQSLVDNRQSVHSVVAYSQERSDQIIRVRRHSLSLMVRASIANVYLRTLPSTSFASRRKPLIFLRLL
ncbi:hypothetical protein OH77DRAFT_420318 [Trametes cingulata]|nr:hypothetical protein OH77DRAFT_420318 [Trametes cingulata]